MPHSMPTSDEPPSDNLHKSPIQRYHAVVIPLSASDSPDRVNVLSPVLPPPKKKEERKRGVNKRTYMQATVPCATLANLLPHP